MENRDYLLQLRDMQISQRSIMRRYSELLIEYLDAVKYKDILKEIGEQLLRLNTLDLFDPNECYIKWQKFVQEPNLDKFLLSFLKTVRSYCFDSEKSIFCSPKFNFIFFFASFSWNRIFRWRVQ